MTAELPGNQTDRHPNHIDGKAENKILTKERKFPIIRLEKRL